MSVLGKLKLQTHRALTPSAIELMTSALDVMSGGLMVIDDDLRVVACNDAINRLLDLPEGLLKPGISLETFVRFAAERGDYGPGDPESHVARVTEPNRVRKPYQLTRTRPDGVIVEIIGTPIAGGFVTRFLDVTEEYQRESDLHDATRSRQRFEQLFELSHDLFAVIGTDGHLHTMNASWERSLGWTSDELGLRPFIEFVAEEDRQLVRDALAGLIGGMAYAAFEVRLRRRSGDYIWTNWHTSPADDGQLFCVVRNVEQEVERRGELERARVAAEAAASAKADFLATMSHEIRTPMNGVIGMGNLLLESGLSDDNKHYAEALVDAGKTLMALINDILDFSKLEAKKLELQNSDFELANVVQGTIDSLAPQSREKNLDLTVDIGVGVPAGLYGDAGRLRQILVNLIGNAIKFTSSGSVATKVWVAERYGDTVLLRFEVTDTGIGIAPEVCGKLFNRFVQGDSSATRKYGGSGLGLAICAELVSLMGGNVGVESQIGKGSTFWFTARLTSRAAVSPRKSAYTQALEKRRAGDPVGATMAKAAAQTPLPQEGNHLRILLVEDNAVNQMLAMAILKKNGHQVEVAVNGREAVESAAAEPYDVILMDVQMPEMDGLEATRAIRALPDAARAGVHIIAMTANALQGDREKCLDSGMDDYLAKPIDQKRLREALDRGASKLSGAGVIPAGEGYPVLEESALQQLEAALGIESVREMIEMALTDAPATLALVEAAVANGDFDKMRREIHDMGSNFGNFGAVRLHHHILEIEVACREGHVGRARELAGFLPGHIADAVAALKRYFPPDHSAVA